MLLYIGYWYSVLRNGMSFKLKCPGARLAHITPIIERTPIENRCTGYALQKLRKRYILRQPSLCKGALIRLTVRMIVGYNVVTLDPTIWHAKSCLEDRGVIRGVMRLQSVCLQFSLNFPFFLVPSIAGLQRASPRSCSVL